jgi:hypothetical protein
MARAKATIDHAVIRQWAKERGGIPACVKGTGDSGDPGMLRIDFPGFSGGGSLQPISWGRWLKAFDANGLAFLYQGGRSRFNKLVDRESVPAGAARPPRDRAGNPRPRRRSAAGRQQRRRDGKPAAATRRRSETRAPRR